MGDVRKPWTQQEDHAIRTFVKKHGTHRWSQISKSMQDQFGQPGRSGKQCRQRWHNHLNPKINRQPWTAEQQQRLFKAHQKHGNKWKSIAQILEGRTDNDIKNKFYSLMRKKLRKISKMLGHKDSTSQIKQIKPKILSNILNYAEQSDEQVDTQMIRASQQIKQYLLNFDTETKKGQKNKMKKEEQKELCGDLIQKISQFNKKYMQKKQLEIMGLNHLPEMRMTRSKISDAQKQMQRNRQYAQQMKKKQMLGKKNNSKVILRKKSTSKRKSTQYEKYDSQVQQEQVILNLRKNGRIRRKGLKNTSLVKKKSSKVQTTKMEKRQSKMQKNSEKASQNGLQYAQGIEIQQNGLELYNQPMFPFSPCLSRLSSGMLLSGNDDYSATNNLMLMTRNSPMMTRNSFRSPMMPTPGLLSSQGLSQAVDLTNEIGKHQTYDNIFQTLKNKVLTKTNRN